MSNTSEKHELSEFHPIDPIEDDGNQSSEVSEKAHTPEEYTHEKQQEELATLRKEPEATPEMLLTPETRPSRQSQSDERSSITVSEVGSGYERETTECTDFCMDFLVCFGLLDTCCPSDGEGYLTTAATFCGNIVFSCCKLKV